MNILKNISFYLIIGGALTLFGKYIESEFLFQYLSEHIIGLLLTLLAINTATSGLLASKIQDITVANKEMDFSDTIKQMKTSLLEQIILIIVSVLVLMLVDSQIVVIAHKNDFGSVIICAVFVFAVDILWDTGKSVFVVIEQLQNMNNRQ